MQLDVLAAAGLHSEHVAIDGLDGAADPRRCRCLLRDRIQGGERDHGDGGQRERRQRAEDQQRCLGAAGAQGEGEEDGRAEQQPAYAEPGLRGEALAAEQAGWPLKSLSFQRVKAGALPITKPRSLRQK